MVATEVGRSGGPMGITTLRRAALVLALLTSGCAHRGLEPAGGSPAGPVAADGSVAAEVGRQALLRVRYRGLDGRGRVRLTVRAAGDGTFQLAAADVFGRQLWSFSGGVGGSLLLDHRRREVCRFDGDVVIEAIALGELPVSLLPRVLSGSLPFAEPAGLSTGEIDHVDVDGRRWTATVDDDRRPERWTLWQDGEALVWWQATDDGAILSHRGGAQVIWTLVAEEPLESPMAALEAPSDYRPGQCDESDVS